METIAHSRENSTNEPTTSGINGEVETIEERIVAEKKEAEKKNPITRFIEQLFHPKFRYIRFVFLFFLLQTIHRDLYPFMFGLDVIAFLIVAFGYSSFGEGGSGNVIGDIQVLIQST